MFYFIQTSISFFMASNSLYDMLVNDSDFSEFDNDLEMLKAVTMDEELLHMHLAGLQHVETITVWVSGFLIQLGLSALMAPGRGYKKKRKVEKKVQTNPSASGSSEDGSVDWWDVFSKRIAVFDGISIDLLNSIFDNFISLLLYLSLKLHLNVLQMHFGKAKKNP
ncbi:hypothetical protein TEA_018274 [Camellia sinensis var. sinensis]|uniref:Uncharacterized protein n=1 Tax=Camellia sinensis var. sinensis TaxID=542762 RepID=A0A4S4DHM4_CAMSN|nr:hypothetical protein TEA_018274 [Camellia sinensis var. sinensis]